MGNPVQQAEQAAQAAVDRVLEAADLALGSADWAVHDQVVNAIMDASTIFYLRTQPATGVVQGSMIPVDFGSGVWSFGCFRATVEPLLEHLEQTVAELVAMGGWSGSEASDLESLRQRMASYRATIDAAPVTGPDLGVWERVTKPLLVGLYPSDFAELGIINPAVQSPPDIVRPYTLGFQSALILESQRDAWRELGRDLGRNAVGVVRWVVAAPGAVWEATKGAATAVARNSGKVLIATGIAAGVAAVIVLNK